jgi:hypothetical protein
MNTRNTIISLGFAVAAAFPIARTCAQTATFNFDNGAGGLNVGDFVPFTQLVMGAKDDPWRAQFVGPKGGFVIQSGEAAKMSGIDGLYLRSYTQSDNTLEINFDRLMTTISINFATFDPAPSVANTFTITAFIGTVDGTPVGKTAGIGVRSTGNYPTGTLTFTATERPFDAVHLSVMGARPNGFAIDSIVATAERCQADFDGDDAKVAPIAVQDIFAFLDSWFACELRADFNHDGVMNVSDVFDFVNAWIAGCP